MKEVEKPVEVIKEVVKEVERLVQSPLEAIREAKKQLKGVEQVVEAKPVYEYPIGTINLVQHEIDGGVLLQDFEFSLNTEEYRLSTVRRDCQ